MSFGKSSSKSYPTATQTYTGGQMDILSQLAGLLGGQIGQGVSGYPGQITPGVSPLQQQAFGNISDIMGGQGPAQEALNQILAPYDPTLAMDYWTKAVKEPAMRTWTEEMIPKIMESYGAQNALSSSGLQKTLAKSGANLSSDLAGTLAQTLLGEKGQWTQAALQAIPMPLQQAMAGLEAGGTQRGIAAEQMAEPYQKWATEQPYSNPWLTYLAQILGAQPYQLGQESKAGGWNINLSSLFS
jgi:hypothetical protein